MQTTREGFGPPPPPLEPFQSVYPKVKDEMVIASDSGLKNEHVAKRLLDGIALAEDLKLYHHLPTPRMLACQERMFYEVNDLAQFFLFHLHKFSLDLT